MSEILKFMKEIDKLKDLKRTGWVFAQVDEPETVASHSFSLSIMSMIFAKKMGLDTTKCIKLSLIHDTNEVYTGDIATRFNENDQVKNNQEKEQLEDKNTKKIFSILPEDQRKEFLDLWQEMHEQETKESQMIKQLDSLDYIIQALVYKNRTETDLLEFFKTANKRIKMPEIREIFEEVMVEIGYDKTKL